MTRSRLLRAPFMSSEATNRAAAVAALAGAALLAAGTAATAGAQTLVVRNNHELPYAGPVQARVPLPDGAYAGDGGATAEVRGGVAHAVVSLAARGAARLTRTGPAVGRSPGAGGLAFVALGGRPAFPLAHGAGVHAGLLQFGLVVIPGAGATVDGAVAAFRPDSLAWTPQADGTWRADGRASGYRVAYTLAPTSTRAGTWVDVRARVVREAEPAGSAYVALVRRVAAAPGAPPRDAQVRFNGRVLAGGSSPDTWDRDFWYTRGVDWTSWTAGDGGLAVVAVNGFTPTPTIRNARGEWVEGSHFYVWERTRVVGDSVYLVAEIAGPNAEQVRSRYMPVTEYAPMRRGDSLDLRWRIAVAPAGDSTWRESQLRGFAGYRLAATGSTRDSAAVDVGVRHVTFGTAYFPYSTFVENLDYYRVPGTDRETWWPISPTQWARWRQYVPQMRTDMHIIRAMGFDVVRLHHLELLQKVDRREALAFLDWYAGEARALGLRMMFDTEGPAEWVSLVAGRYRDIVDRVEIENEILIGGVKPGSAERWTALYEATKRANPGAHAFLTTAGNHGQFERLRALGVPFDRVGLHAYKHGAQWPESFRSHALGTGGYASDLGLPSSLGEFNWKDITRLAPEARHRTVAGIFDAILEPRALPEVFQFQFHEMLAVSPSLSLNGGRHYEAVGLDRRPKPEAMEWTRLIRAHGPEDAPVRELPVTVTEVRLDGGAATAAFTVTNRTTRPQQLEIAALAFDGAAAALRTPARVTLAPGASHAGRVALRLPRGARPGTYHHFVRVSYLPANPPSGSPRKTAYGWGVAAHVGAPTFAAAPVLGDRVAYPQGADVVRAVDWVRRPLAVTYGETASVLEVEMAFLLANTLQAATGRPVRVSSARDIPDSLARGGTLLLVGTPATHPLIAATGVAVADTTRGVVATHDAGDGRRWLVLTGADRRAVQAAASDVVLRFWPAAKDAAMRRTGMERGNLLGNRAGVTEVDPPE